MNDQELIQTFLSRGPIAVVGASRDRSKYGNKVFRAYIQNGFEVFPVNPNAEEVEGYQSYPNLASLPIRVRGISVVTPPHVTEQVIEEAGKLGINLVWLQPGAESAQAIYRGNELGMHLIAKGPCVLVALHYREHAS